MPEVSESLWSIWERIRATALPQAEVVSIPPDRCLPVQSTGYWINEETTYFTVRVNEMHLAANQEWFVNFDPLVVIVTEFDYGTQRIAAPMIVGPDLIPDPRKGGTSKHGTVLEDILVAGPHPYRGGDVALSIRFYKVETDNLIRSILKTISSLSKLSAGLHEIESTVAVAGAILTGLEGLLGLRSTICLAAYRGSLAPSLDKPFRAQVSALITPPAPTESTSLWSVDGRLQLGNGQTRIPYRSSDFVLVSVEGSEKRSDINKLPFGPRRVAALKALTEGDEGVTRAKGILLTAYSEMLESPEMTARHADEVFDSWLREYESKKVYLERVRHLGPAEKPKGADQAGDAVVAKLHEAVRRLAF